MTQKLLTIGEVATRLRCSDRHVRNLVRDGYVPKPIKIGKKTVRWTDEEINACIAGRLKKQAAN